MFHSGSTVCRGKAAVHGVKCSCTHRRARVAFKAFHCPLGMGLSVYAPSVTVAASDCKKSVVPEQLKELFLNKELVSLIIIT